jgi:hypothetical protein
MAPLSSIAKLHETPMPDQIVFLPGEILKIDAIVKEALASNSQKELLCTFDFSSFFSNPLFRSFEEEQKIQKAKEIAYKTIVKEECSVGSISDQLSKLSLSATQEKKQRLQDAANKSLSNFGHSLPPSHKERAQSLIHSILFKFVVSHEKIDDSFIMKKIEGYQLEDGSKFTKEDQKRIYEIICKALGEFPRLTIEMQKEKKIKRTIIDLMYFYQAKEKGAASNVHPEKESCFITNFLLYEKKKEKYEGELNEFLEKIKRDFEELYVQLKKSKELKIHIDLPIQQLTLQIKLKMFEFFKTRKDSHVKSLDVPAIANLSAGAKKTLLHLSSVTPFFFDHPFSIPKPFELSSFLRTSYITLPFSDQIDAPLINAREYLQARIPKSLQMLFYHEKKNIEIFLGSRHELEFFYQFYSTSFEIHAEINCSSSFKFFYVKNKFNPKQIKIVVLNVTSESRALHLLHLLRAMEIKAPKVLIRGSFSSIYENERKKLEQFFTENCLKNEPKVLFLGVNISNYLNGKGDRKYHAKILKSTSYDPSMISRGSYGLIRDLPPPGSIPKVVIPYLSFSMPNGELAYHVTKFFLEKGVKKIIMIGAGGAITTDQNPISISSYVTFSQSLLRKTFHEIPKENLLQKDTFFSDEIDIIRGLSHLTVSSPLEETQKWLEKATTQDISVVDVESGHVFKAFNEQIQVDPSIKILPGLFISDVINHPEETLCDKISHDNAYQKLPSFLESTIKTLEKN